MNSAREQQPGRLAIIAGGGKLPLYVAEAARRAGEDPLIIAMEGETALDWSGWDHVWLGLGNVAGFDQIAHSNNIDRVVMCGAIKRRPALSELRLNLATLLKVPEGIRKLVSGGDNALLTMVANLIERRGRRVIGAHEIAPDLLAETGPIGQHRPDKEAIADIGVAIDAALTIGRLDIGQAAVTVGGRVVALEGPEGTDEVLLRVADLKSAGRVSSRRRGVLVKLCKPGQDERMDLPSIGVSTLENAHKAGLAGVAIEAGRSLVLDRQAVCDFADRHGMFVYGIDPQQTEGRAP
ncbi:LpxI family protein [Rhizobium alvei]|uniref:UDP-2,3-diacylglucosamine diphosphatase LpxI n=1 Tax=Rhizobium alvei TaxID=1132659 RepID=A0ABT8YKB6_9HYPH|nr:UDP-2,3-diacylglucosamine diphosphatase LpxI [Rhizobium alvei]MDO6964082.1 UDP-2,3-diacylglucosamine diphosphatase LpxI [Rhizobium alvei]